MSPFPDFQESVVFSKTGEIGRTEERLSVGQGWLVAPLAWSHGCALVWGAQQDLGHEGTASSALGVPETRAFHAFGVVSWCHS